MGPPEVTPRDPLVSVVVPVRDRRDLLRDLLAGLDEQTRRDFEVIVVDDGSSDGSGAEARRWSDRLDLRVLEGGARGAVEARTRGVAASTAEMLAFIDSDCVPRPDWLEQGIAALERGADVVAGRTVAARRPGPLDRTVESDGADGLYPTCNVFYRRGAFDAAGGFDDGAGRRLGFRRRSQARALGFGEDTLLAWRVRRNGGPAFVADAVVEHAVFPFDPLRHFERTWMVGAFPSLLREVPELRASLLRGGFVLGRPTRLPLFVALVAAAAERRRLAAAALVGWLLFHAVDVGRSTASTRQRISTLPVRLVEDVVVATALTIGSVRARVLVL